MTASRMKANVGMADRERLLAAAAPTTPVTVVEVSALRGLTIRQPWADAVAYLGKDVENRTRRTTYTGPVLIHAGLQVDKAALSHAPAALADAAGELPGVLGAVIAVSRITGAHACDGSCSPWAEPGRWHWQLAGTRVLSSPVTVKGALGLWIPTPALRALVTRCRGFLPASPNSQGASGP
ncbi:hypothetical protein ACFY2W_36070 [Streptomyces sp. NPDC001262]|uniref:hypothetical protein n=1 Tax=Streptomyces sp. NPDC001262 TaxID=3364552 RepID=UPI00368D8A73